jgi:hypothetical protein
LRAVLAVVFACLGLAVPASALANHGPEPWEGGAAVVSPLEAKIAAWTNALAERPTAAYCQSAEEWSAVAVQFGLPADQLLGAVFWPATGQPDYMLLSPTTCTNANEFLAAPAREGQKACQVGTRLDLRTERYTVKVTKLVRVKGKLVRRVVRVKRTRQVQVEVPVYELCATYVARIDALMTVAHESMHVVGIGNEAAAECLALQTLTPLAAMFGAKTAFAYEIGRDYLPLYALEQQQAPDYWSADCRDGGLLDLFPKATGWPTPPMTREQLLPRLGAGAVRLEAAAAVAGALRGNGMRLPLEFVR